MPQPILIKRTVTAQPGAQHRWDLVYQYLVKWSLQHEPANPLQQKENNHESSDLCPCINPTPGAKSEH